MAKMDSHFMPMPNQCHLIFERLSLDHRTLWSCSADASHSTQQCTFCAMALLLRETVIRWQALFTGPFDHRGVVFLTLISLYCWLQGPSCVCHPFIKKTECLDGVRDLVRSYSRYVIWSNNDVPKESWTKEQMWCW